MNTEKCPHCGAAVNLDPAADSEQIAEYFCDTRLMDIGEGPVWMRSPGCYEAEIAAMKRRPITPTPGPPDLEGVPDDAKYIYGSLDYTNDALMDSAKCLRERSSVWMSGVVWHVGPIVPGKDGE